jgi:hypothetical protein
MRDFMEQEIRAYKGPPSYCGSTHWNWQRAGREVIGVKVGSSQISNYVSSNSVTRYRDLDKARWFRRQWRDKLSPCGSVAIVYPPM